MNRHNKKPKPVPLPVDDPVPRWLNLTRNRYNFRYRQQLYLIPSAWATRPYIVLRHGETGAVGAQGEGNNRDWRKERQDIRLHMTDVRDLLIRCRYDAELAYDMEDIVYVKVYLKQGIVA